MAKVQIKSEKLSRSGEIFLSIDILLSNNRTTKIHLCFLGNGNTMSLGDACACLYNNCLHKKVVASISDLIYGDHFWGLGAGFINYHLYKISTPPIL